MKKFLQFIRVLIGPVVEFVVGVAAWLIFITWVFTFFGLLIIFAPNSFPTPEWVRWSVIVFDILCIVVILYGALRNAYEEVYKK